jgi:uncharacterized repeat protein (TIGR01451 family)
LRVLHERRSARHEVYFIMRSLAGASLVILALAFPGLVLAATNAPQSKPRPNVTLKLSGSLVTHNASGQIVHTPIEGVDPKPGDEVEYDIAATNAGAAPALRFVPVGRIPTGTAYVEGSAKAARAHAEFSLDGGKTWSANPTVTVKGPNGTTVVKKADPSLYTTIRFVTNGALAPHGTLQYAYEVRVK